MLWIPLVCALNLKQVSVSPSLLNILVKGERAEQGHVKKMGCMGSLFQRRKGGESQHFLPTWISSTREENKVERSTPCSFPLLRWNPKWRQNRSIWRVSKSHRTSSRGIVHRPTWIAVCPGEGVEPRTPCGHSQPNTEAMSQPRCMMAPWATGSTPGPWPLASCPVAAKAQVTICLD